jgi:hypothetical protein
MRYTFLLSFVLLNFISFSQTTDTLTGLPNKTPKRVSFITKVDIANATKDGIYLNGYIVNLDSKRINELNGKTVKVSGKVTIVKGLNSQPKELDSNGQEIIKGGRGEDARHIFSPKIKIIAS